MTTQQISQEDYKALKKNHSLIYEDRRTALRPLYTPYCDIFTRNQHNIFHPKSE